MGNQYEFIRTNREARLGQRPGRAQRACSMAPCCLCRDSQQAICAGRRKKAAKGEGREGQQDLVETRRTNEMDKKAGGEADPEAMRLHIINSCLFALDSSPFCNS